MPSANDELHVDCRARWAKVALLLWEYPPGLAEVAEAGRDNFHQDFAIIGNKRNLSVFVAIRAILLFMKDLDGGIFPFLGDVSRSPHKDKWVMKAPDEFRVVEFSSSAGNESDSTAFQFSIPRFNPFMSSMVELSPSDGVNGRCENRALMVGSNLGYFLFRRVWKNPPTIHECAPYPRIASHPRP